MHPLLQRPRLEDIFEAQRFSGLAVACHGGGVDFFGIMRMAGAGVAWTEVEVGLVLDDGFLAGQRDLAEVLVGPHRHRIDPELPEKAAVIGVIAGDLALGVGQQLGQGLVELLLRRDA